jgi:hypothetical protein
LPGLSASTLAAIARLEHNALSHRDVEVAYHRWKALVTAPIDEIERANDVGDHGGFNRCCECSGPPDFGRRSLDTAIRMLPTKAGREVAALVRRLDQILVTRLRKRGCAHLLAEWWR